MDDKEEMPMEGEEWKQGDETTDSHTPEESMKVKERLKIPFNYSKFIKLLQETDPTKLYVHSFVDLLFEITKMFHTMGKTMSRAFSGRWGSEEQM